MTSVVFFIDKCYFGFSTMYVNVVNFGILSSFSIHKKKRDK